MADSSKLRDDTTSGKAFMLKSLSQTSQHMLDQLQRVCRCPAEAKVRLSLLKSLTGLLADEKSTCCVSDDVKGVFLQGNFERRATPASAELYFHYYGLLQHQCVTATAFASGNVCIFAVQRGQPSSSPCRQNMLQDMIRTGTYYAAIMGNFTDFKDKVVMDVGSGTGILSLFAAQVSAANFLPAARVAAHICGLCCLACILPGREYCTAGGRAHGICC